MIKKNKIIGHARFWAMGLVLYGGTGFYRLSADDSISLKYTYRPESTSLQVLHDITGQKNYLPLMEVSKFFDIQVGFDSQTRRVTLTKGKNQVKLVLSQPFFLTGDPPSSFPMDEPVEMVSGQLGITPETLEDILGTVLNVNVNYSQDQKTVTVGGIQLAEIRQEILAQATPAQSLTVSGVEASVSPVPSPIPQPVSTPLAQESVSTPEAAEPTESEAEQDQAEASEEGQEDLSGWKAVEKEPSSDQIYQVRRVVIDPGHGGVDGGARGFDGRFLEKQATLEIGRKVANLLRKDGRIEVFMTRNTDKYITLKYRTDFANRHDADLFVSIHCNSNPKRLATGTETYIYSPRASNKLALVAAVHENQGKNDLDSMLADLHHNAYTARSYKLAEEVDQRIRERLKQHMRPVLHAPFYVLRQVDMPSLLIETAFISNKTEEMKLRDSSWQDKIAKSIADGILAYRDVVEESLENQQARR